MRILIHFLIGAGFGYIVLHPLSMIVHAVFHESAPRLREVILASFSVSHLSMAAFFAGISGLFGMMYGFYIHIIGLLYEDLHQANAQLEERVRDRTRELTEVNAVLEQHVKSLEEKNKDLEDYAFMSSHQLQEPLRKIHVFADLIRTGSKDDLPGDTGRYLDIIAASARHMRNIIQAVRTYAKVSRLPSSPGNIHLNDLVEKVLGEFSEQIASSRADIRVESLPELCASPVLMHHLFRHLIDNALKFAGENPPRIRIYAVPAGESPPNDGEPSGGTTLVIEDVGIGFEEKYLERIFMPLQRLHPSRQIKGVGMGLAICRKIARLHGGTLNARSTPGKGSTFMITLPQ